MTAVGIARGAIPCLALDIGASRVEAALVSPDGTIVRRERREIRAMKESIFAEIVAMIDRVGSAGSPHVVGVGCAGPMTRDGEEVSPLNIAPWHHFPLRSRLRDALNLEVFIDGDARALALAEGAYGGARDDSSYLSMVVSTGIVGGLVMDGRLVDGDSGNAGHVGHLNVVPNGRKCSCGSFGCLEAEASGSAIEAMTGRSASEADMPTRRRTSQLVGRAVGTLAAVLDFNRCYVAGSVALGFGDEFIVHANEAARGVATMEHSTKLEIHRSQLGSDGPLLGAALVGWRGAR